ncbi:DUF4403 family protein [Gelidibacter mesophilus]|uniref:DUF4403 family protein n=1 Tax=Gelidibacter mesophilus TaxID=169050 RepID=UPI000420B850|nr:DUF4403 family protein [Gelidibacter mesophilus]
MFANNLLYMNSNPTTADQSISITLPVRIDFTAIEKLVRKKFNGTTISKNDAKGKASNYFNILEIYLSESQSVPYNLALTIKLQTLTLLFHKKDIEVSVLADLRLDVGTQKLYVKAYKINSSGESWITNTVLKSVLNTFVYNKLINILSVDLMPILKEKIDGINAKLASQIKATKNISIMGNIEDFNISHFNIKKDVIWVLIYTQGWGVISIEDLEL